MMSTSRKAITAAVVVLAACTSTSKTKTPVTTSGNEGASTSPAGTTAAARGEAMVRLVNALPTAPMVQVKSGDSALFANVKYKDVTEYREVGDKTADFKLVTSGQPTDKPAAENHEMLGNGGRYTVLALPEKDGSGASLKVMRDELTPDSGKAQVRVINAAPGVGEIDVVVGGAKDPLFNNVNFGNEAGFKTIEPATGSVTVRSADKHKRLVSVPNTKFEAGKSYTFVITGSPMSKVEAITFNDAVKPTEAANN